MRVLNFIRMTKKLTFTLFLLLYSYQIFSQQLVLHNGYYYTDNTQSTLYTGPYTEVYPSGALKLEMFIKNGLPDGIYVVYFENGKIEEVRSYYEGKFHGTWRTYDKNGILIAEAHYNKGKKNGIWRIWDDNGILRYEMRYKRT